MSSLQLGKVKSTRDDGRDKSTQAGPPLLRTEDRDSHSNPHALSSTATRIDADKNKAGFARVSSSTTPDTLQSTIANVSIPTAVTQASEHGLPPVPSRYPSKPGDNGSDYVQKEKVASLTSTLPTGTLLEDKPPDTGQTSSEANDDGDGLKETRNLPITGPQEASAQVSPKLGGSSSKLVPAESYVAQKPTIPLDTSVSFSPIEALDDKSTGRSIDASLNVQAEKAQSFHAGPSTPEEQLRREEAQSLSTFSPQAQPMNVSHSTSQKAPSNELANGESRAPTSSLESEVSIKPVKATNSPFGESQAPTETPSPSTPGMVREVSKDLMLSQRPPIHIDTAVASQGRVDSSMETPSQAIQSSEKPTVASGLVKQTIAVHPAPPERMTTRVSSGALRQKSVSEILGETPRPSPHSIEKIQVGIPTLESPGFRSRQNDLRERERERSKLSTVVFTKPPQPEVYSGTDNNGHQTAQDEHDKPRDYLLSLFHYQASQSDAPSISALLGSSHKTLTTADQFTDLHEKQMYRITRRIYDMQNTHHWPLRQVERSAEPIRPATHWDVLMGHVKWLRTDFREERKWKLTVAKNLADWCAEWVASPHEQRPSLQVRTANRSASHRKRASTEMGASLSHSSLNDDGLVPERTPDLIPSREDDSSDLMEVDTPILDVTRTGAAAGIFSLAPDDVVFDIKKTPVTDRLLSELYLYQPWADPEAPEAPEASLSLRTFDKEWNTPLLPVSKYAAGKLQFVNDRLPSKRSRYDYESEDGGLRSRSGAEILPPDQVDVALFDDNNSHIRERIHAGHAFKPPSEYPMPSQSFFEARHSSQWTMDDDDELRISVREYAYNWSLISSCLSFPSLFTSGAERRTPWECFERWIGIEGLPTDMAKMAYFRAYHGRLDAAQRTINATNQALQQQHGNNPQVTIRRRTSQPVRVQQRRQSKHLVMVQAMSKLAKRRETAAQKQQHGMKVFFHALY